MSTRILHLTLGPVQGFIAQGRRTRDLWAGSFLLSWLTGQAMKTVIRNCGRIIFPVVHDIDKKPTDDLLKAIMDGTSCQPLIGTLPNRFKAEIPDDFDPVKCKAAMLEKWLQLADAVKRRFLCPVQGFGQGTLTIWDRQINHFWDINYVIGPVSNDKSDSLWLDARKYWQTAFPPAEGGDHCAMMGEWQEVSGYVRAKNAEEQDRFWKQMRDRVGTLNLRDRERLCAIALVKRLFPCLGEDVFESIIGWIPGGYHKKIRNWPSTAYMAAIHWIERAGKQSEAAQRYVQCVEKLVVEPVRGETATEIECLKGIGTLAKLDGSLFFVAELANPRATSFEIPEGEANDSASNPNRKLAIAALEELQEGIGAATPFYALLMMDGDHFGRLLRDGDPEDLSSKLAKFSELVPCHIREKSGALIYAGGDDVLALVPLEDAIPAALALHQDYVHAFDDAAATTSAAVVYAHYHIPLRTVLSEAHDLLKYVAKERNGRDSLAISVLQGAGKTIEWVSTWTAGTDASPPRLLVDLAKEFGKDKQFSNRFFYNIRNRFGMLTDDRDVLIGGVDPVQLLTAEYLKNREQRVATEEAEVQVKKLYQVCQSHRKSEPGRHTLGVDGALLVRFLANKSEV
ncbi:MAG: type III-B CRISPR-associated protein Cas10/Cmr2 [Gammaproteobacteria bacterium]|nr:type III-B CRISPR-associated protein Cas10/Cmr2 [Gammaproteobacteria bacterium]